MAVQNSCYQWGIVLQLSPNIDTLVHDYSCKDQIGQRYDPANYMYRTVSLTFLHCKLLEHVVVSNVIKHVDQHKILTDSQHGFCTRRSCETQLVTLVHDLASAMDKGIQTDMVFLDFSKAFGRVPHQRLLRKLHQYGIRGHLHEWISSFLTGRTQSVVAEGISSESAPVVSRVPQGSVLGPLLFLLFINDLPDNLTSKTRLFSDDCIVYRTVMSPEDYDLTTGSLCTCWLGAQMVHGVSPTEMQCLKRHPISITNQASLPNQGTRPWASGLHQVFGSGPTVIIMENHIDRIRKLTAHLGSAS